MSYAPQSVSSSNGVCHVGENGVIGGHDCPLRNGGRFLATKPRPANINISTAGFSSVSGLSSIIPSIHLNGVQLPNTPTSPSHQMSSPQTAPLRKPSTIRSFFVCKAPRSNSVAPFPKSPTSSNRTSHLAHFSYNPSQFAPTVDPVTHNPVYPSSLAVPTSYASDAHVSSSNDVEDDMDDDDVGKTSNSPVAMISLTRISCDRDTSQLPSPISPPEPRQQPFPWSAPVRLGPHDLVIPPYEQLQKKREDLKRKDTSHLPQQNVDGEEPSAVSAFPSKLGATACEKTGNDVQTEKLTVSAKYLTNHTLNPDFSVRYMVGDELGSGGFGFVVSAKRILDGREVAVKFIHKDKVPAHGWIHDARLGYIPMEIYVIKNFPHPGMISYLDMYDDFKFFYLVMELHGTPWTASNPALQSAVAAQTAGVTSTTQPGGLVGAAAAAAAAKGSNVSIKSEEADHPAPKKKFKNPPRPGIARRTSCDLFECIEHHSKFSENKARHIFKQIVDCVKFLNDYGICHRDIKDENIVIDKDLKVKLIDFGSAVIVRPTGQLFDRFYGTINYASPEILRGEKYRAESAEIWSLGILLYTLLYGEVPFNDPKQAIYGSYVKPKVQSSRQCMHLLHWMLQKNSDQRASIDDVFCHAWLNVDGDGKP